MEETYRRIVGQKSDDDSEKSFSESEVDADDLNESPNSSKDNPEEVSPIKAAEGSEYESAEEEEKAEVKNLEESNQKEPDSSTELVDDTVGVDEEGGEEGIAENEDVEEEFLNGDVPENGSEEDDYVEEERQQGDGEECSPNDAAEKELDFDEDRRNPQYIPKKGMFYEHDDRNNEDLKEKEEEPTRDRKKKLWLDEGKWGHDRFRLEEQYPKSKNELIETYGYDIRNEDGPPRARRRRRYGRGPTKYSRNWEDGTAYGREKFKTSPRGSPREQRGVGRFRGGNPRFRGRGRLDFNSEESRNNAEPTDLNNGEEQFKEENNEDNAAVDVPPIINREEFPALPSKIVEPEAEEVSLSTQYFSKSPPKIIEAKSVRTLTFENSNFSGRNSAERDIPPRRGKTPFSGNHDRGMRRPNLRGNRGSGRGDYNRRGRSSNNRHISPRFLENKVNNNLSAEMEYLSLDVASNSNQVCDEEQAPNSEGNGELPSNVNINELQSMALKGAGDSAGRPKRYSSLRQRSLPETSTYQNPPPQVPTQHPTYYDTAGYPATLYAPTETCVPTPSTQSQTATSAPIIAPAPYQTFTPPPYPDNYALRMSVTTPPPRLYPQPSVPPPQPILAPATCIPPAAPILNFPPPPPTQFHQFAYQQYPTPSPPQPAPAPPNEIYQPGITYYYPPTQHAPVRQTIQKRGAKAIPIVPPPDKESNRKDKNGSSVPNNSSNRKYTDTTNEDDNVNISGVRTESSSQLQSTVGVES